MRGTSKKLFSFILTVVAIVFCLFCFKVSVHADGSLSDVSSDSNKENVEAENTIDVLVESNSKQLVDDTNKDLLKDDNKGSNDKAESNSTLQDSHIDSNSTRSSGQERIEKSADGKLYYIDSSGKRKTSAGWIYFDGKKYFASPGGSLYTNQMITFGSYGYYMGSDGSVVLGHFRGADGVYRYADATGNLEDESYGKLAAVGWREDNYFAHGGYGELYHNQFISFGQVRYYMNTDGSVVKTDFNYGNKRYSPDPATGEIKSGKAGWIIDKAKNTKKFSKGDGTVYFNRMITFGKYGYYMGSDGSVVLGHFRGADGVYRYADAIGELEDESYGKLAAVGWREDNYFAHGGYGELYHNQFITFGDKIYYMTGDGSVAKSKFQFMKGVIINPGPTGLISLSEYNYYLPQISAMQSARSILKQIGNSLWAAYKWAGSAITYKNMTTDADKGISYFANIAFNQRSGNCYTMASAFYYMALSLGYDVYQVSGFHQGRYKEWPHSWCEIRQNGGTYIYDPDILKEMDREIYGRKYGESGTLKYLVSKNKYMKL